MATNIKELSKGSPNTQDSISLHTLDEPCMPAPDSDMDPSGLPSRQPQHLDAPGWHPQRKRKFSTAADNLLDALTLDHEDADKDVPAAGQSLDSAKRTRFTNVYTDPTGFYTVPTDKSKLPMEVWHHIFSFLSPVSLGKLLRVNKRFNFYLTSGEGELLERPATHGFLRPKSPNSIWSACRKNFNPGMPRPLANMTELDMWRLVRGTSCQFCGKNSSPSQQRDSSPWESGPGLHGVRIMWPFAIRSCADCLIGRAKKDVDLVLSSFPTFLVPALPFLLITPSMHIIPSVILRSNQPPSGLVVTKYYYTPHIEDLKRKFEEVEALGPAALEEWIKGLESEGRGKITDAARWEQWEASGGLQTLKLDERRGHSGWMSPAKPTQKAYSRMNSSSGSTTPLTNGKLGGRGDSPPHPTASMHGSRLPPRPFSPSVHQTHVSTSFTQPQPPRAERSLRDVNEAKALRRAEIERRCLDLDPPLTAAVLSHMDSFSAAIQIPHPFTDRDWDILKPRLLAQREIAERREQERLKQSQLLQAKSESDGNKKRN
ncbi:hypothetical protein VTN77DRAFT_5921 [Rasamsonia byssochlamydoides]|uniref:uncharacterized protein n=1 Tax=Rasamsonia byssochlamydoides TaxID=89139 RepID=UPI003743D43E